MSNCKECIHDNICPKAFASLETAADNCNDFKDRSKFADVSELQLNVIRPLTNRCADYTKCQMCFACVVEIREHCEHYKKTEQSLKERRSEKNN